MLGLYRVGPLGIGSIRPVSPVRQSLTDQSIACDCSKAYGRTMSRRSARLFRKYTRNPPVRVISGYIMHKERLLVNFRRNTIGLFLCVALLGPVE